MKRREPRIHARSVRMRNNAGVNFPVCMTNMRLLDLRATGWLMALDDRDVTCKRCSRVVRMTSEGRFA